MININLPVGFWRAQIRYGTSVLAKLFGEKESYKSFHIYVN